MASSCDQSATSSRTGTVRTRGLNSGDRRTASFSVVTTCAPMAGGLAQHPRHQRVRQRLVIGQRVFGADIGPHLAQRGEEFLGMPDPGEGQNGQAPERQAGGSGFSVGRAGSAPAMRCALPLGEALLRRLGPDRQHESARARPVSTGSRSGPAGSTRPLPKPRWASTTTIERSWASTGFWNPSSSRMTSAPAPAAARAPASLSLATQVFAKAARSSASSPVSDAR
jgi:hypothetical protein